MSCGICAPNRAGVSPLGGSFRPRDISEWGRSADLRNRPMMSERVAQAAFIVSPTRTASKSANTLNDAL